MKRDKSQLYQDLAFYEACAKQFTEAAELLLNGRIDSDVILKITDLDKLEEGKSKFTPNGDLFEMMAAIVNPAAANFFTGFNMKFKMNVTRNLRVLSIFVEHINEEKEKALKELKEYA